MIIHHDQVGFIPMLQGFINIHKSTSVTYHINKLKNKNHIIISIDAKNSWQNSKHSFRMKTLETRHRGNLPQHNEGHIWQTHRQCHSQRWKPESISSKIRNRTRKPTLVTIIQHSFEVLATAIREEQAIKGIQLGKLKTVVLADDMILYIMLLGRKTMTNLDSVIKKQRHHFAEKGPYSQSYGFSSSHVWTDVRAGP